MANGVSRPVMTVGEVAEVLDRLAALVEASGTGDDVAMLERLAADYGALWRQRPKATRRAPRAFPPGERFGLWTVVGEAARDERNFRRVTCRCDCGAVRDVYATHLTGGNSSGCLGCRRRRV